jgi:non-homologous end joining protein Ku
VKKPDFAAPSAELNRTDLDLAENLVTQMTGTFAWESLKDPAQERLDAVIRAKAETGQSVGIPQETAANAPTADLTAALLASVEKAKADNASKAPVRTRKPAAARRKAAVA